MQYGTCGWKKCAFHQSLVS